MEKPTGKRGGKGRVKEKNYRIRKGGRGGVCFKGLRGFDVFGSGGFVLQLVK